MLNWVHIQRLCYALVATAVIAGTMGGCEIDVTPNNDPVVVELVNNSSVPVAADLWADPDIETRSANVAIDSNYVNIGDPLAVGEVATITLECADAGTLLSNADFAATPVGDYDGAALLRVGEHFECGDTVTYTYEDHPVAVELTDTTSNDVAPYLWADPGTLFTAEEVAIAANAIDIGDPLAPNERATVILECADAGTLLADGDLLTEPDGTPLASDNLVLIREGEHYLCGDTVSFYYEVDGVGGFFITLDINGETVPL